MDHLNVTHVVGLMLPDHGCRAVLSKPTLLTEPDHPIQAAIGIQTWPKVVSERCALEYGIFFRWKSLHFLKNNESQFILLYDSRGGKCSRKQRMDQSCLVASRHGCPVIRRMLPKNYLTFKRRKVKTYKVIVLFIYSPVHIRSGRIIFFLALRDVEEN